MSPKPKAAKHGAVRAPEESFSFEDFSEDAPASVGSPRRKKPIAQISAAGASIGCKYVVSGAETGRDSRESTNFRSLG